MSRVARRIVDEMPRGQPMSTSGVARLADLAEGEVERHLEALEGVGVVEEIDDPLGSDRVWLLPRGDDDE